MTRFRVPGSGFTVLVLVLSGLSLGQTAAQTIAGTVRDGAGTPISGVIISIGEELNQITATTDSRGRYSIHVPGDGTYELKASARRFARVQRSVAVRGARTTVNLLMPNEPLVVVSPPPPPPAPPPPPPPGKNPER